MNAAQSTESTWTHPFEAAGLGKAPFRFVDCTEEVYQACPGAPIQPGASCDYCGQGIRYVCWIRDAAGREFKVGCDCVYKTSAKADDLSQRVRAARNAMAAEKREETRKATRAKRLASPASRAQVDTIAKLGGTVPEGLTRKAASEMIDALIEAANEKREVEEQARRDASRHVGAIGKRIEVTAKLVAKPSWDTAFGPKWAFIFEADGATIVWKTSSPPSFTVGENASHRPCIVGDVVKLRGTVSEHATRDGIRQTIVQRCKVEPVELAPWE